MIIVIFLLFFFLNSNTNIIAAEKIATPSAKETKTEEIKSIRDAIQKKVKEKIKEIGTVAQKSGKKGIVGAITQIENNQITVEHKNKTFTINVSTETVIIDLKRNKTDFNKIKVGQEILAMGTIEDKTMEAKRIVLIDLKTLESKYKTIIGTVVDVSKSSPVFVVVSSKNKDLQYQIKSDSLSEITDKNNKKFDFKNLSPGQKVVVIIKPDEKIQKTFYVSKVIILGNLKAALSPTTSPSPTESQ